jgi:tetratricopeptide (TPR) repeat protein
MSSRYDSLSLSLNEGRYDDVIKVVSDSLLADPDAVEAHKYLGIAYFQKKNFLLADSLLTSYNKKVPADDQAMYYLALSSDSLNDEVHAIEWYRKYSMTTTLRAQAGAAMLRSNELQRRRMQRDARHSVFFESSLSASTIDTTTVAVLSFENNGSNHDLDPLGRGLAEMVTTDLTKVHALKVVERLRLQTMLEELKLSGSNLAAPESGPRVGKLVGAHRVVKGSYAGTDDGMVHIDAAVTKTSDAIVEAFDSILGPKENIFRAEKDLVLHLLRSMGIQLSTDEREAILTIPTENYFAFLRYAQGLEFEDRGQFAEAASSFKQALELDPKFVDAHDELDYISHLTGGDDPSGAVPFGGGTTIIPRSPLDDDAITMIKERAVTTSGHTGGYLPTLPNPVKPTPVLLPQLLPLPPAPPVRTK